MNTTSPTDITPIGTHLLQIIRLSVFGFAQKIHTPHALKCCGAGRREINPTNSALGVAGMVTRSERFPVNLRANFITYVRYNWGMTGAETSQKCAWCGNEIPPRSDPRGRKARYCCGACRASAARERTRNAHQDELKQAQAQTQESTQDSLLVASPDEILATVVSEIDATTRLLQSRPELLDSCAEMVNAARKLVAAVDEPAQQTLTRQQRRKLARQQKTH